LELGMATLQRLGHRQTNRLFLRRRHVMPDHPGTAVDHQHGCHGGMAHAGNSERKGNGNQGATIRLHDGNLQGNTASISTRREDSDILRQTHDSAAASCRPELVETAAAIIWNSVSVYGFATGNLPVATLEQRQSQQAYRALDHESPSHGGVTIDSKASRPEPRRHSAADTGSHVDLDGVILGHMSLLVMNLLPYLDGSLLARQHTEPRVAGRGHRATAEFAAHLQLAPLRRHDRKAAVPWRQLANGRLGHVVELVVFEAHGGVKP